ANRALLIAGERDEAGGKPGELVPRGVARPLPLTGIGMVSIGGRRPPVFALRATTWQERKGTPKAWRRRPGAGRRGPGVDHALAALGELRLRDEPAEILVAEARGSQQRYDAAVFHRDFGADPRGDLEFVFLRAAVESWSAVDAVAIQQRHGREPS